MIAIRTSEEIVIMREGGQKLGRILDELLAVETPGVSLLEIEKKADELIVAAGGTASFKTVKGYTWATCLCVNDVVVHGVPTEYKLQEGDVLTIDIGLLYKGFHTDTAWTKIVKSQKQDKQNEKERFLAKGEEALWKAIEQATVGNRVGNISKTIQDIIEGAGYSIITSLVGHGVGKELHEDPQIPGVLRGTIDNTALLKEGMTIAIEVIYAMGQGAVEYSNNDGWTLATKDGSLSAVFEHTIEVAPDGPHILTRAD